MSVVRSSGADSPGAPHQVFRFGRNWQRYVSTYLDADRERIAAESLRELVGDLHGKTFLDVGCGSGLFSLCAHRCGASKIVSFDVDLDSVAAARLLHQRAGSPANWQILHGSILASEFLERLERADVVYSWGVLHHTGDMYTAIRNAASLVNPAGIFAIAIYNRVTGRWLDSRRWWQIKRAYNRASRFGQRAMELAYGLYWLKGPIRSRTNPVRAAREYRRSRGMALWTDMRDWLGGYPYEFATAEAIVAFCEQECGMRSTKLIPVDERDTGNNQFVFVRSLPIRGEPGTTC